MIASKTASPGLFTELVYEASNELVVAPLARRTEIPMGPAGTQAGARKRRLVAEAAMMVAGTPPTSTVVPAAALGKPLPVSVTSSPAPNVDGLTVVSAGPAVAVTVTVASADDGVVVVARIAAFPG